MRKLIYSMMASLDGYFEDARGGIPGPTPDEQVHRYYNDQTREAGALLSGRRMHELMAAFWPTADEDPSAPDYVAEFAEVWRQTPKIVVSRSKSEFEWADRVIGEDLAGQVTALKQEQGGPLQVGGAEIATELIRLGLVDEVELLVLPTLVGGGRHFIGDLPEEISLRLIASREFDSGVAQLRYELQ